MQTLLRRLADLCENATLALMLVTPCWSYVGARWSVWLALVVACMLGTAVVRALRGTRPVADPPRTPMYFADSHGGV